ncbi:MAG: hypothetical protein OXR62_05280 [Ahrensia sp.]|nr:hypothetical protein [Ahrensia sp.]
MSQPARNAPQLTENLLGAVDIMLGRERGLERIDISERGFLWSFSALILVLLIDMPALSLMYDHISQTAVSISSKPVYMFGKLLAAAVAYVAAMVALYLLCRSPKEQFRFPGCVIVHNWAAPTVSIAVLPIAMLNIAAAPDHLPGSDGSGWVFVFLALMAIFVLIGVRIIRITLDSSLSRACLYFAVSTMVSLVVSYGLEGLMGLTS